MRRSSLIAASPFSSFQRKLESLCLCPSPKEKWDSSFRWNDGRIFGFLEALLRVDAGDIARPLAMIALQQPLGRRPAGGEHFAQRIEEARFVVARGVEEAARVEPALGDGEDALAELRAASRRAGSGRRGPAPARRRAAPGARRGSSPSPRPRRRRARLARRAARPRERARRRSRLHGPPSAPRISRKLLRRTSGKMVER